jgi:hypothetical protein
VSHDGGDLRSRPVRRGLAPRRSGRRSGGDGGDGADGREHGKALTHAPQIDRAAPRHYPRSVVSFEITPEPDDAERRAILEALAAEKAEQPAASEWAASALPSREEKEP